MGLLPPLEAVILSEARGIGLRGAKDRVVATLNVLRGMRFH